MIAVTKRSDLTNMDHTEPGGVINLNAVVLCVFQLMSFIGEFESVKSQHLSTQCLGLNSVLVSLTSPDETAILLILKEY